jgi:hypothetical protein
MGQMTFLFGRTSRVLRPFMAGEIFIVYSGVALGWRILPLWGVGRRDIPWSAGGSGEFCTDARAGPFFLLLSLHR